MVGQNTLEHLSNSACVGRVGLLPELGETPSTHLWLQQPAGANVVLGSEYSSDTAETVLVRRAPSLQAGTEEKIFNVSLGKTPFFRLIIQGTSFKCSFLLKLA